MSYGHQQNPYGPGYEDAAEAYHMEEMDNDEDYYRECFGTEAMTNPPTPDSERAMSLVEQIKPLAKASVGVNEAPHDYAEFDAALDESRRENARAIIEKVAKAVANHFYELEVGGEREKGQHDVYRWLRSAAQAGGESDD